MTYFTFRMIVSRFIQVAANEEEEKEEGSEKLFEEIKVKNDPNKGKEIVTQIQKAQSHPG